MTIHSETVIDEAVAKKLAEIAVEREDKKYPHRRLLLNLLCVALAALAAWHLWYWYDHGLGEEGRPLLGILLVLMAATVLYYANCDQMKLNLVKLKKSMGTRWYYDFGETGVRATFDGEDGLFEWDAVTNWWEEKDFFCLDITGNPVVVPKDQFNMKQRSALRDMLDKNVRIRTEAELKAERKAAKAAEKSKK